MKSSRNDARVNFPLRLPVDLRAKLERVARASHRSLNGEILFRLERSIREEREDPSSDSSLYGEVQEAEATR
jgi:hypothetical protein